MNAINCINPHCMDRKAARYIDHRMQAGHTPADIDAALRRQGFDSHDIARAWRQARAEPKD
jgi:SOS response regulatory protein OraA/RecX